MKTITAVLIAFFVVIINGIIGHVLPPTGIFLMPIVMMTTTLLLVYTEKSVNAIVVSFLVFGLIALNDIVVKVYSGGTHDQEGLAWIQFFTLFGIVPAFIILLIGIICRPDKWFWKVAAVLLFIALTLLYFPFIKDLLLNKYFQFK